MDQAPTRPCAQLNFESISALLSAAQANSLLAGNIGRKQDLLYLQGKLDLMLGHPDQALDEFDKALALRPSPAIALKQAATLGAMGYPSHGLQHLQHYERIPDRIGEEGVGMPQIHAWVLQHQQYWPSEIAHLRKVLAEDALHTQNHAQ
jgi:tetratricopeptide (TPR) repeat protein